MTSHEAIGWMRICRPGSVIGHQQEWLEQLEPWLIKQGNLYRKRTYQDTEKMPLHEYGLYSIAEKTIKPRHLVFNRPPSPPPPIQKHIRPDRSVPLRPQNSRIKEVFNKAPEKECDWAVRTSGPNVSSQKIIYRGGPYDAVSICSASRRSSSGAGDPRAGRPTSRTSTISGSPRDALKSTSKEQDPKNGRTSVPITTYRTSQAPIIKNVTDARNYLMQTSIYNSEREKQLSSTVMVTPHYGYRPQSPQCLSPTMGNRACVTPSSYSTVPGQPHTRRRLGRSPSPQARVCNEQTRATNTPSPTEKFLVKDTSKTVLKDVLSRLRFSMSRRDGSLGAASLGATRDAPAPRRAPSVRSDERPLATQGDKLNSIKLQRRLRESLNVEKPTILHDRVGLVSKVPSNNYTKNENNSVPRTGHAIKPCPTQEFSGSREKAAPVSRSFYSPVRPMSPKGRRNVQSNFYP